VGKWHAKDVEEDGSMNFDDVLRSIRNGKDVPPAVELSSLSTGRDFVFVMGEMEEVQNQASKINEMFPLADIVYHVLTVLTADGNYTFNNTDD
jgi:hypothetical protein